MRSILNEESFADLFAGMTKYAIDKVDKSDYFKPGDNNKYIGGSISKYTKGLLMSFPMLIDDSLALESAMNISKANEKNITSMMEMLFASMSINAKDGMTGKDIIALFHKNIDSMPIDDYIDAANNYVLSRMESAAGENLPRVKDSYIREAARDFVDELKVAKKRFPVDSFNERSLNDYMTKDQAGKILVYEAPMVDDWDKYNQKQQEIDADIKNKKDDLALKNRRFAYDVNRDKYSDKMQDDRNLLDLNKKRLIDSDFKKANELQPTMLVVTFNIVGKDDIVIDRKSFICGIKCRAIATTSMDIAERLLATNKSKFSFKNLIRATTGEIKFGRDFLFAIQQQKLQARNDAKRGEAAKLWNTLKSRSNRNSYRKLSKDGNDASAITTLVISQDTVNFMKNTNKFDIGNVKNAKHIMDAYNLLCVVIADDANEVCKFLYDGNNQFETLSYSMLSKEAAEKSLRKELNLLSQRKGY